MSELQQHGRAPVIPPPVPYRARRAEGVLDIGLVNNSAGAAFGKTRRQFSALLRAAAAGRALRLHVFCLPGVGPPDRDGGDFADCAPIEALAQRGLDALIITGAEPSQPRLQQEPYWPALTRLLDWAEARDVPLVLSCLAAHAAVLHRDGVERVGLPRKRFGIFAHEADTGHALLNGVPARYMAPHSRCNEVPEAALRAAGYRILSRSEVAGVEIFAKSGAANWLYLQGHPEYEPRTLVNQFRRDLSRFARGEQGHFPALPEGVFADETVEAIARWRGEAGARGQMGADLPELEHVWPVNPWRAHAELLFANWLDEIALRREALATH